MKSPQLTLARRRFLFAAASGAAATAAVTAIKSQPVQKTRAQAERSGSGYRLTEHIRNYYRTAKV